MKSKQDLVKSALEEYNKIIEPLYSNAECSFAENLDVDLKDLLTKQITLAYEEGKDNGKQILWKLSRMIEERLNYQYSVEGYPPMTAVDVVAMINKLLSTKG